MMILSIQNGLARTKPDGSSSGRRRWRNTLLFKETLAQTVGGEKEKKCPLFFCKQLLLPFLAYRASYSSSLTSLSCRDRCCCRLQQQQVLFFACVSDFLTAQFWFMVFLVRRIEEEDGWGSVSVVWGQVIVCGMKGSKKKRRRYQL